MVMLALVLPTAPALAAPYVAGARLIVSVDDFADFWLNGTPVITRSPITLRETGVATFAVDPCLFASDNLLAFRCTDSNPTQASIQYLLKIRWSDGSLKVFSSRDVEKHRSLYVQHPESPEPEAWWRPGFNDKDWNEPMNLGRYSSFMAMIDDQETGKSAVFLSASDTGGPIQTVGERHLFRRPFQLVLADSPACGTPSPSDTPTATDTPTETETSTGSPTETRTPTQTRTPTKTRTSTKTPRPRKPTPTWTFLSTHTPRPVPPTRTRVPLRTPTPYPPLKTPTPWRTPTKTATPKVPTSTQTPRPPKPTRTFTTPPTKRPTSTFTPRPIPAMPTPKPRVYRFTPTPPPEALVFENLPVRVFVEFKDGPGVYTVDVRDRDGNPVKRLFEETVSRSREDWVDWDGTDETGARAPSGVYQLLCRKGSRDLKRVWIVLKTRP